MNQLTGVNRAKQFQIESDYQTIHNHAQTLSDDQMFIEAMREFRAAYFKMDKAPIPARALDAVREDYRNHFYPDMQRLKMARPRMQEYLPFTVRRKPDLGRAGATRHI